MTGLPPVPRRNQRALPGPAVLALLIVTCALMLGAIYWVVRSARP
ncbi:MAG TPA: hypothetical protein VF395_16870 [Polyangiaceae bacterium]